MDDMELDMFSNDDPQVTLRVDESVIRDPARRLTLHSSFITHHSSLIIQICLCLCLASVFIGCGRGTTSKRAPIHPIRDMDSQPKYKAQSSNKFFYNRMTLQEPVPGTVAIGELETDDVLGTGVDAGGTFVATSPLEPTPELIARGADRYEIYCTPCHRASGDGQGILFRRGGVPTTSLHEERLVAMPDGELFDAITNGVGLMPSYAYPISVRDRWAIVAYVRELQKGP